MISYALFPTTIGECALAWSECGLTGVWFPEATPEATRVRIERRLSAATEADPPPKVAEAMARIAGLLETGRVDLADIDLDLDGIDGFERRVLEAARGIAPGATLTYGELATRPARWARPWPATASPSSSPATGCWPPAAASAAFPRPAAWKARRAC